MVRYVIAGFAAVFGLMTIFEGGSVLFIDGDARVAAGNYVPWVLGFNFLAGFAYVGAAGGIALGKSWAVWLAAFIAAGTLIVSAAFAIHVATGGLYENRTVVALMIRSLVWVAIAMWAAKRRA